jgi:hypothetical protein
MFSMHAWEHEGRLEPSVNGGDAGEPGAEALARDRVDRRTRPLRGRSRSVAATITWSIRPAAQAYARSPPSAAAESWSALARARPRSSSGRSR